MIFRTLVLTSVLYLWLHCVPQLPAQDGDSTLIDFGRDVMPILQAKCIECHGPDDAKNDFRVDDQETLLAYLEPGDLESSSLWTDYMITDDEDMRMPPPDKPQLSGVEMATVKLWIEEGAQWSDPPLEDNQDAVQPADEAATIPASLPARIWSFQGLFHPASVHFPIALLSVSTFCLLLSFFNRDSFEPAAFHCLWLGALGGIVASIMGWAYAQHEGYGSAFSFDFQTSSIDRHRWLGIAVALLAVVLVPMARSARKKRDLGMRLLWLLGSLCLLGGVAMVGYQGGELTYGEDHYAKEFARLFPEAFEAEKPVDSSGDNEPTAESEESSESADTEVVDEPADESIDSNTEDTASSDPQSASSGEGDENENENENADAEKKDTTAKPDAGSTEESDASSADASDNASSDDAN